MMRIAVSDVVELMAIGLFVFGVSLMGAALRLAA